jgi:hypothetical protein
MIVEAQITITGSKAAVWAVMTDIEKAPEIHSAVEKIEVVERPANGIIGLKWRETRKLFGTSAKVEKVIIAGSENEFYTTHAADGGFLFSTYNRIWEDAGVIVLRSIHKTTPQGFIACLKALPMVFFKSVIKKAILQDLNDIKAEVERRWRGSFTFLTPPMLPTRPCSFCLSLQGGSVFADFDTDDANIVSLRRISYDGYGCCEPKEHLTKMNSVDSRLLLDAIARGELRNMQVEEILRRYFRENTNVIWSDALKEHDLL